jgi:protein gp37
MNKQFKIIDGVKVKTGIEWCDFSWNPVGGCKHACQWRMPSGEIANCYAEDVAEGIAASAYPMGFEHHYWKPQLLQQPLNVKEPSKIFVGSMADLFGHWVPDEQIEAVLDICRQAHWHTFQLLTKNPVRATKFTFPRNVWVGASTPPDFMWNKPLSPQQRGQWLDTTLKHLSTIRKQDTITWLSAEPITIDVALYLRISADPTPIDWMVIGAASNGKTLYAPDEGYVRDAVHYNDLHGIKSFYKGNLKVSPFAAADWREEFPIVLPFSSAEAIP